MAGIVLAGGKSSRMGCDKALLPWGETTLLNRTVSVVQEVSKRVIVVTDSANRYSLGGGAIAVGDNYPGTGPLGGIITGLESLPAGFHLVVAGDMPLVNPTI